MALKPCFGLHLRSKTLLLPPRRLKMLDPSFPVRSPAAGHCRTMQSGSCEISTFQVPLNTAVFASQFSKKSSQIDSGAAVSGYPKGIAWKSISCNGNRRFTSMQDGRAKAAASATLAATGQDEVPLLRKLLAGLVKPYLNKNPTAIAALDLIKKQDPGPICYDHFAFRTFGVDGCGIDSIAQVFLDLGYSTRDELRFPGKKLRALWFSPPEDLYDVEGELENGPLPRIFISEILVDQLSAESQRVIRKYTKGAGHLAKHAAATGMLDALIWPTPSFDDYQQLASESEYAAWTLLHGFALNHATVSVHRLHRMRNIDQLNQFLLEHDIKLNSEGGVLKISPDGGLQQSSSVADSFQYKFAGSEVKAVPASYIEFAQRLVLPVYTTLKHDEIYERHRRDGFEVGNADKIFESTSSDQTGVQRV